MGGNGSGSGLRKDRYAFRVIFEDGRKKEFFTYSKENKNYMLTGITATPRPTPANMKGKEMADRYRHNVKNVRKVERIPVREWSEREKKYRRERADKPDYEMGLRTGFGNKDQRKAARAGRQASRRK